MNTELKYDFDLQGHRGARGLLPENSLPAFRRALEIGVTTLEMDVVITADEEVVVSHEPWMSAEICSDPSGKRIRESEQANHNIFRMTYEEVRRYDCGSNGNPRFPKQQKVPVAKPLLRDVIRMAEEFTAETEAEPVHYNIETKSLPEGDGVFHPEPERFTELLYAVLKQEGVLDRSIIQSFDVRTLIAAKQLDDSIRLALLHGRDDGPLVDKMKELGFAPDIYSPDYRLLDERTVSETKLAGVAVIPWTVNDPSDMVTLLEMGVDGLITDYPDIAVGFKE